MALRTELSGQRLCCGMISALIAGLGGGVEAAHAQLAPNHDSYSVPLAQAEPLPIDPDVAARPPAACDLPPEQFIPRSTWNANLWPGGVVPYEFDANVTQANQDAMRLSMNELETVANITFVLRTSQTAYLHVKDSTGNNSSVGRTGSSQTVNIYNWSYRYIMEHELMHALGEWHEQSRPDRATYVNINSANIQSGYSHNFDVQSGASTVGAFDFESIMLYDACSFSTCCAAGSSCNCTTACSTIQAQPAYAQFQNTMGNRSYLSTGDKAGLAAKYGAPTDDVYEPNDTLASAKALSTGTFNLRLVDSDDYFSIAVVSTSTLVISDTHSEADSDVILGLYNSAGTLLQSANTTTGAESISRNVTAGTYIIRVQRNARWGGAYSLTISGCNAPTVSSAPAPALACLGGGTQFSGAATDAGSAPFTFNWFHDGELLTNTGRYTITPGPSGRSSTLSFTGMLTTDVGQYWFTAANGCSTVTSAAASLGLTSPPQATFQASTARPCRYGTQIYTANPGASGSFTYRWQIADDANRTNWRDITAGPNAISTVTNAFSAAGQAASTLTLSNISIPGPSVASFRVIATGPCGPSTSAPQDLAVCAADFNCDGQIAVADIFSFLNAWFASDPHTDINGLAGLQVADIFAFFSTWMNGCP